MAGLLQKDRKPTHRAQAANAAAHGWCGINSGEETDAGKTRTHGLTAVGGAKHLSGLRYGLRSWMRLVGLGCGQFWPDFLPIVWAQVAAGYCAVCGDLNRGAMLHRHGAAAHAPIAHSALHHAHSGGQLANAADDFNCFIELLHTRILNTFVLVLQTPQCFIWVSGFSG
jgi:hypothetical protein